MQRTRLSDEEITLSLTKLDGWEHNDGRLTKRFTFPDFAHSLEFVNKVAALAEAAEHHPDIEFGWGYAKLTLTTHDRGGVTDFDTSLAAKIDRI